MTREPTPVSEPTLLGLGPTTEKQSVAAFFDGPAFDGARPKPEELATSAFFDLLNGHAPPEER